MLQESRLKILRRYHPAQHSIKFASPLWPWPLQCNLSWLICHKTKFGCKRISSSEDIRIKTVMFWSYEPCDLELQDSNPIFCMTLQLMMMYHLSQFGYKKFNHSEDIIRTNWYSTLAPQQSNIFIGHFGLWWSTIKISLAAQESLV